MLVHVFSVISVCSDYTGRMPTSLPRSIEI